MLSFLEKRATGEVLTGATYLRNFVSDHEEYNKDSIVSNKINYDLVRHVAKIGGHNCGDWPTALLGDKPKFMDSLFSEMN